MELGSMAKLYHVIEKMFVKLHIGSIPANILCVSRVGLFVLLDA